MPHENFPVLPVVTSDPYDYGVPDFYQLEDDAEIKDAEGVEKVGAS